MRFTAILVLFGMIILGASTLQRFGWLTDTQTSNLLVATVPLLGVLLTLNWNQQQFERNQREERDKANLARKLNAKQAAFIEAVDAVITFLNFVATFPDRELPPAGETPKEAHSFSVALTKLHFFAEFPTIECAIRINKLLVETYMETVQAKLPSSFLTNDIKINDSLIESLTRQQKQLDDEILVLLKMNPHHELLPTLQSMVKQRQEQLTGAYEKKSKLIQEKYHEVEKCRDVVVSRLRVLYPAAIELYLAARSELNFPIDADRYKSLMTVETEAMLGKCDEMIISLRAEVSKRMAS
jgi:hypothetical protein